MLSLRALPAYLLLYTMSATLPVPLNVRAQEQQALFLPAHKPTSLPVANSTTSFWLKSPNVSPSPTHGSEGPLANDVDVCIIGSGITGVSAAYHLANEFKDSGRDVKAVILEAREFCAHLVALDHRTLLIATVSV